MQLLWASSGRMRSTRSKDPVLSGLGAGARLNDNDKTIYVIVGDGESREGQVSEALDFIMDQKLTGVVPIFNENDTVAVDELMIAFGDNDRLAARSGAPRPCRR